MEKTITKKTLAEELAQTQAFDGLPVAAVLRMVDTTFAAMVTHLQSGNRFELRDVFVLESRETKARRAHNPKTGQPVMVAPARKIRFRAGRLLKGLKPIAA